MRPLLGSAVLTAVAVAAGAATAPSATRTELEHRDQSRPGPSTIVLGTATLPPGAVVDWHVHPGDEAGYVLSGHLVLRKRGQPDRALAAGDHFFNARGEVHRLEAAPGAEGVALSTWVVDRGAPLATAAPPERR
jgi:quercetin dioxygenase-like cupin family protein